MWLGDRGIESGMRILQIANDHPRSTPGGAETSLQRLGSTLGGLHAPKHDLALFTGVYERAYISPLVDRPPLTGIRGPTPICAIVAA